MENRENTVEVVYGNITNRNVIESLDYYENAVKENAWKNEMYRSYYSFPDEFKQYVKVNKSVKEYDGSIHLDYIHIDIDKGDIDDKSFQGYLWDCLSQLLDKGVMAEDINVWFSGNGYHLKLRNVFGLQPSKELNTKLRLTMDKHFSFGDSIYDKTRIIRSEWSLNKKTNLYKIPITTAELLHKTAENILELAKDTRIEFAYKELVGNSELEGQIVQNAPRIAQMRKVVEPKNVVPCVQEMLMNQNVKK